MSGVIYLDWSAFPVNSRHCLDYYARQTSCDTSSAYSWNYCLCNNGDNWIGNIAVCLNQEDPDNLELVWTTMNQYCDSTFTPIVVSMDEWLNAAHASDGVDTTLPVGPVPTPAPAPTKSAAPTPGDSRPETTAKPDSGGGGGGGLSTSDKIAIGVGVPVGFFSILGAIVTWWMCCCRGR